MNRIGVGAIGVLLSFILFTLPALAIPISRADFPAGATTLTFDGLPVGTLVDTEYQSLGVTFTQGGVVTFLAPGQVLSVTSQMVAEFSLNVDMVGIDIVSASPLWLQAYNSSGVLIDTVSASSGFLGLSTGEMISYVIIHDSGFGFTIDNFTFADPVSVPEPGILILLGIALSAVGLASRHFKL